MRRIKAYIFLFLYFGIYSGIAAQPLPDSVKTLFNAAKTSSDQGIVLNRYYYNILNNDSILQKLTTLKEYFKTNNNPSAEDYVTLFICRELAKNGEYSAALNDLYLIMTRFEHRKDGYGIMSTNMHLSYAWYGAGDEEKTIYYDKKALELCKKLEDEYSLAIAYNNLSADYSEYGFQDSGFVFGQEAYAIAKKLNDLYLICKIGSTVGESYIAQKKYDIALPYLKNHLPVARTVSSYDACFILNDLSQIYLAKNLPDSAIYYGMQAIALSGKSKIYKELLRAYNFLYLSYDKMHAMDSAFKYFKLTVTTKDSIYSSDKAKQIQAINIREQNRLQAIEQDKLQLKNEIRLYVLIAGLGIFLVFALFLYRSNRQKQKANFVLQEQNQKVENTLEQLKSTQSQLIQSEKMASLGELTAGIAHEIQNPLNFVNNFSEVNNELADEINNENNIDEIRSIASDIKQNSEKILFHGKRADAIVKGMLQHSRQTSGIKEPTDINALCDEYLRLSYHGLRAKDKNFNADFKTDFDETIGKINIVPQDIGRVLLNLFNNAFYTTNEKKETADENYKPLVSIQTKRLNDNVEIRVSDNGNGVPQNIIDKIFQPFFTTKPTGQGTGLGLSLSYDIIKAHGGEIRVETKDGEGTTFIIQLPTSKN
jgi:two-component system, NtrC family, sensor kinase